MNKRNLVLAATALAGLALTGCSTMANDSAGQASETVMCHGVNSCKGHGQCGGKVDACSGKNGCESTLSCAGKNSCKGKGLLKMSKKDCKSKGGKIAG